MITIIVRLLSFILYTLSSEWSMQFRPRSVSLTFSHTAHTLCFRPKIWISWLIAVSPLDLILRQVAIMTLPNTLLARTELCIALGIAGNIQGSVKCFSLNSGKVLVCRTVKELSFLSRILKRVNDLGLLHNSAYGRKWLSSTDENSPYLTQRPK